MTNANITTSLTATQVLNMLPIEKFNLTCKTFAPGAHTTFMASLGRMWPATKAQAKKFYRIECINSADVERIEATMNKHGYNGRYRLTKSGQFAQLENIEQLQKAIKAEFSI